MSRLATFSITLLAAAVLTGCASGPRQRSGAPPWPNPPHADSALLFFYAQRRDILRDDPSIYVDGIKVFTLRRDSYSWCYTKPGSHNLRVIWEGRPGHPGMQHQEELKPGQSLFVRVLTTGKQGPGLVVAQMQHVPADMAKTEIEHSTFTFPIKPRIE